MIPDSSGTYALILRAKENHDIVADRSGHLRVAIKTGWYIYIGSACGSGGVRARLGHHFRPSPNPVWHVDRIKVVAPIQEAWYATHSKAVRLECAWSRIVGSLPGAQVPTEGVGSADCEVCPAHFYRFEHKPSFLLFEAVVREQVGEELNVRRAKPTQVTATRDQGGSTRRSFVRKAVQV